VFGESDEWCCTCFFLSLKWSVVLSVREEEVLLLHQKMGEFVLSCFFDLDFKKASGCVCTRLGKSQKGRERRVCLMPLS
jgi:hypothetical protein